MDRKRQKCLSLVLPILKSSILSGYGYLTAVWRASQTGRDTFTLPGCAKAQKPVKGMRPHFCVGYGSIPPVAWEGNRGTCSDFRGQPRNCPPFNYPIFLLRYHVFLHQEPLTKVTTCLKSAHDQQLTPLSNLDVLWSKRTKIIKTSVFFVDGGCPTMIQW